MKPEDEVSLTYYNHDRHTPLHAIADRIRTCMFDYLCRFNDLHFQEQSTLVTCNYHGAIYFNHGARHFSKDSTGHIRVLENLFGRLLHSYCTLYCDQSGSSYYRYHHLSRCSGIGVRKEFTSI